MAGDQNSGTGDEGMSDRTEWPLQKIREAYLDAVELYNALYPLLPTRRTGDEEIYGPTEDYNEEGLL